MKKIYKWNDGILEEQLVDLIDLNGWILFGWSLEIPEQPIEVPKQPIEIPEQASRKRSSANASDTSAA